MGNIICSDSQHLQLQRDFLCSTVQSGEYGSTKLAGGLPGYTVLENVWYHNRALWQDEVFTSGTSCYVFWERWYTRGLRELKTSSCHAKDRSEDNLKEDNLENNIVSLNGTSFFLNDGWSKYCWSGYSWYYHFMADMILGGFSALFSATSQDGGQQPYIDQTKDNTLLGWTYATPRISIHGSTKKGYQTKRNMTESTREPLQGRRDRSHMEGRGTEFDLAEYSNAWDRQLGSKDSRSMLYQRESESREDIGAERIIFAWDRSWTGRNGMTPVIADAIFSKDNVIAPDMWDDITREKQWIYFERGLLIIDRRSAERYAPWSYIWRKPAYQVYDLISSVNPGFFEPIRARFLGRWGLPDLKRTSRRQLPASTDIIEPKAGAGIKRRSHVKIVCVNRQNSNRRFNQVVHRHLVDGLHYLESRMPKVGNGVVLEIAETVLEGIPHKKQFAIFADADINLGIHGNGLTHEVWMPMGGTLIEILPPRTFVNHFPPISKQLGHGHIIWRNDTICPRALWSPLHTGDGNKIRDGFEIPLHVPSFIEMLERTILHFVQLP
ncbi:hypothetical protein IAT40_000558 [Kwoniella sp. CBS 6097]